MSGYVKNPEWGSDTRSSMPVAPTRPRLVPMGGFCFTDGGMAHDISEVEAEALAIPHVAPYTDPRTAQS